MEPLGNHIKTYKADENALKRITSEKTTPGEQLSTFNDAVEIDSKIKNKRILPLDEMKANLMAALSNTENQSKNSLIPSSEALKEAFLIALKAGGISKGNPPDSENVVTFKTLFENGEIKPGDIILVGNNAKPELSLLDSLVPGNFSHVGMYLGKDSEGNHKTIDAWCPEAQIRDVSWWPESYNHWSIIRPVKPDGSECSEDEMKKVLDFAKNAEGCKYNFKWVARDVMLPVDKDKTGFYCSQLAWASYYYNTGIDIDANPGATWNYANGVAPQELYNSKNIKIVAEHDFSNGLNSKESLFRFTGGVAGAALTHTLLKYALVGSYTGIAATCAVILGDVLGAVLGIWSGKILYQATR